MTRQGGLGRGLDALIPAAAPGQSGLLTLPLDAIVPNRRQPRGSFDQGPLEELAQSLQRLGMLQPVLVRPLPDGRYELIAGERRTRAARLAGLEEIPAIVRSTEDSGLLTEALVENMHRADLNPLEEAAGLQQLLDDFGLTHDELAERLGKSRPAITNTLRLLGLSPALQHRVASGSLSPGHARALLGIKDRDAQERVAARVVAEGLSVRATEELVRTANEATAPPASRSRVDRPGRPGWRDSSPYGHVESRLGDAMATRVQITGDERRGRIVIDYAGAEDLERLLGLLSRGVGDDLTQEQA